MLLVGDSAANVVYGHDTTIPVTVDDLVPLTVAAVRGTSRALVVVDLPFLLPGLPRGGAGAAGRVMKETGAHAVKLEGGSGLPARSGHWSRSASRSWGTSA